MCKYTTIFVIVDDFCKMYNDWINHKLLSSGKLNLSEVISIIIFYHFSQFKHFKIYYQYFILKGNLFTNPPCYNSHSDNSESIFTVSYYYSLLKW